MWGVSMHPWVKGGEEWAAREGGRKGMGRGSIRGRGGERARHCGVGKERESERDTAGIAKIFLEKHVLRSAKCQPASGGATRHQSSGELRNAKNTCGPGEDFKVLSFEDDIKLRSFELAISAFKVRRDHHYTTGPLRCCRVSFCAWFYSKRYVLEKRPNVRAYGRSQTISSPRLRETSLMAMLVLLTTISWVFHRMASPAPVVLVLSSGALALEISDTKLRLTP